MDPLRQAMLKTALETIPMLGENNYGIWKDKMDAILNVRGCSKAINGENTQLEPNVNDDLKLLLISKLDSSTHNNVVTPISKNSAKLFWKAIIEKYASTQASNWARVFNDFLYQRFNEDQIDDFTTKAKVCLKKMSEVGILLPNDILAYHLLFKFPNSIRDFKHQIMHTDKELTVEFVFNHLNQINNKSWAQSSMEPSLSLRNKITLVSTCQKPLNKGPGAKTRQCTKGYHNPKQDKSHSSDNCWHLHPEIAPNWWKEEQTKWRERKSGSKEKTLTAHYLALVLLWINHGNPHSKFLLDSGTSVHMFNDGWYFIHMAPCKEDAIKTGKEGDSLHIKGRGMARIWWGDFTLQLSNCFYVPNVTINLISAGALNQAGCQLTDKNDSFSLTHLNSKVFSGSIINNLYTIPTPAFDQKLNKHSEKFCHTSNVKDELMEIHCKFGHASLSCLGAFIQNLPKDSHSDFECINCIQSKISKYLKIIL